MSWNPAKLAQNAGNPPSGFKVDGMLMEPKYDGFRLLANVEADVNFFTRSGISQDGKLPHLRGALAGLPAGTWLDGEIVSFDNRGLPEWGTVQSRMGSSAGDPTGSLTYVVFDVLAFNGIDVRPLPLTDRRAALEAIVERVNDPRVLIAPQFQADMNLHDQWIAEGMEGSIVKDPQSTYSSGKRGKGWTKLKLTDELDVVIMGWEAGRDLGVFTFGQYQNGILTQRGRCKVYSHCSHLKPGEVISVAHNGIMPSGAARHAVYKRHRIDKSAIQCEWS
jgi:ATP-dependent DNA ligase